MKLIEYIHEEVPEITFTGIGVFLLKVLAKAIINEAVKWLRNRAQPIEATSAHQSPITGASGCPQAGALDAALVANPLSIQPSAFA